MKKLMVLSAMVSMLALWSCGNEEDEMMYDDMALENPLAPRGGDGLDASDDQLGRGVTARGQKED